jgi:uncharacterized membrane protein YphA (DoxX/SURF4 family)
MIGLDKFFPFMEPPCSLTSNIAPSIWKVLGILQLAGGVLIWFPKIRKYVAGFFIIFMLVFSIYHIMEQTYDIGGAISMAIMLGVLVWNPSFLSGKKK